MHECEWSDMRESDWWQNSHGSVFIISERQKPCLKNMSFCWAALSLSFISCRICKSGSVLSVCLFPHKHSCHCVCGVSLRSVKSCGSGADCDRRTDASLQQSIVGRLLISATAALVLVINAEAETNLDPLNLETSETDRRKNFCS